MEHAAMERLLAECLRLLSSIASDQGDTARSARLLTAATVLDAARKGARTDSAPCLTKHAHEWGVTPRMQVDTAASETTLNPLSPREQEVAPLIARGLTNRQIAYELVIAERTVDTHVQNILNRLGLASRAQVAAWVVTRPRAAG